MKKSDLKVGERYAIRLKWEPEFEGVYAGEQVRSVDVVRGFGYARTKVEQARLVFTLDDGSERLLESARYVMGTVEQRATQLTAEREMRLRQKQADERMRERWRTALDALRIPRPAYIPTSTVVQLSISDLETALKAMGAQSE